MRIIWMKDPTTSGREIGVGRFNSRSSGRIIGSIQKDLVGWSWSGVDHSGGMTMTKREAKKRVKQAYVRRVT